MPNNDPAVSAETCHVHQLAALVHLSGIFTLFIGPLVVYLSRKAAADPIRDAAREALNFQLTLMMAWVLTLISFVVLIGFMVAPFLALISIALPVWAAVTTSRGESFRYPLVPRLLR
jgi:hypothetical protein